MFFFLSFSLFLFLFFVCGDDSIVTIIKSGDDSSSSHKWKKTMLLGYKTLNNLVPLSRRQNIILHNLTIILKNSTTINILTFLKNFSHHMQLIWLKKKWFKTKIYSLPRKKKKKKIKEHRESPNLLNLEGLEIRERNWVKFHLQNNREGERETIFLLATSNMRWNFVLRDSLKNSFKIVCFSSPKSRFAHVLMLQHNKKYYIYLI